MRSIRSVADHVVAEIDGGGKAIRIGSAMAFHDDAVQAEEDAAIGLARHPSSRAGDAKGAPGEAHSRSWPARCGSSRRADIRRSGGRCLRRSSARCCRQSPRSRPRRPCLCRCRRPRRSRDSPCEVKLASRRMRPASLTSSWPLISSTPTLSRPTVGRSMPNTRSRHGGAENGEIDQLLRHLRRSWRRHRAPRFRRARSATVPRSPAGR